MLKQVRVRVVEKTRYLLISKYVLCYTPVNAPKGHFLMENSELKLLYTRVFKFITLWANASFSRSLLVLFIFLIVGIPLIEYFQNIIKDFPYFMSISNLIIFVQQTFKISDYLIILGFLATAAYIYLIQRDLSASKEIKDVFKNGLNKWALPIDSGWTTQSCKDALGKMLSVTDSPTPGTLKDGYSWYDYEITFLAKIEDKKTIDNPNFTIILRAESNFNGIMLQFTKSHLRPHFIYNGTFIVDNENTQRLPTVLNSKDWMRIKLTVKDNNVSISIDDYVLQYKIPTRVYFVTNEVMIKGTISIEEVKKSNDEIKDKQNQISDIISMKPSPAKDAALRTLRSIMESIPPYMRIILDYQKGSVGFREFGREQAYFRNLKVRKI